MRVLAAAFPDDSTAHVAEARLIAQLELEANQIGVEALAHLPDRVGSRAILAGRFREDRVGVVRKLLEGLGGTLVIDIDDGGRNG
jgi:hypothetical protein